MLQATSEGSIDRVWRLPEQLAEYRPEAIHLLDLANDRAWRATDPTLLEMARLTAATLIGNGAARQRRSATALAGGLREDKIAQLGMYFSCDRFDGSERDCLAFVEQFVIDVSGISDANRATLQQRLGDEAETFVSALYVTEFTQRLEMMSSRLLPAPGAERHTPRAAARPDLPLPGGPNGGTPQLREILSRYQDAVVRGRALDPVVTELVRLRCARTHNCRICQTLRLTDALVAGADDAMAAKIDFYEKSDLDERTKIALRITDAFITRPDTLSDESITQARETFSPDELAELCLDITKWSTQKIHVALGTDGADRLPTNEKGVSYFQFADDGQVAGFSALPDSQP